MLCITIAHIDKWVNVLNSKVLGASKHVDYALFHWKAADVKALKVPITKFIYVGADDKVIEVILADQLKARGCNYKTAKRDSTELTDVELAEVGGAIELARAALASDLKPKSEADTKPPVAHTPADGVPKVIITDEAAANGLCELLAQAESTPAGNSEASEGEAAFDIAVETEVEAVAHVANESAADSAVETEVDTGGEEPRDETQGDESADAADTPADDPLATVKPSRKKRRR